MPKNIAFCADGTWNHPDERDHGLPAPTNVYKFYKALPANAAQLPRYDDGVGADGTPIDRLLGGAIGDGLFAKIKEGYSAIAHAYRDGDRIFLFGFSRGAYTARSLAGMIAACGLPEADKFTDQAIADAFAAYRAGPGRGALVADLQRLYGNRPVEIAMVGVWDTVGALGIPGGLFADFDHRLYGFLDTALSHSVKAACHALALDEKRAVFLPTLWDALDPAAVAAGNSLDQAWFTGVHCDVGGGYAETGLSDITLGWMMRQAVAQGLQFDAEIFARYAGPASLAAQHATDAAHDSWNLLWGLWQKRTVPADATIANSVAVRLRYDALYRPTNLLLDADGAPVGYAIEAIIVEPPATVDPHARPAGA